MLWWLGNVIIIATYTANLAAFLTSSRTQSDFTAIQDLGTQTELEYGKFIKLSEIVLFLAVPNGIFLAPPPERQRSFSNPELSVVVRRQLFT